MSKVKKIITACISLLLSAVSLFSFAGCNRTPEPEEEKIEFSWDMSALTVATERAYAKATGGKSESVLDASVLNDIIGAVDYEEIRFSVPFYRTYLYSIEIDTILEFYVDGSYEDVIGEYCGSGPYRVLVTKYNRISHQRYISHSSDYGFRERYFSFQNDDYYHIVVAGASGQLLCALLTGESYGSSGSSLIFGTYAYALGLGGKMTISDEDSDSASYIVFTYNDDLRFECEYYDGTLLNANGYRHEYTIRQDSIKTYETHDEYLVTDLTIPAWYNKAEYVPVDT